MGSNLELKRLLEERLLISKELLDVYNSWNRDMESAEVLVGETGEKIKLLKDITLKISDFSIDDLDDEDYENNLKKIIVENQNFIERVEMEKKKTLKSMEQTNNIKDIRKSYVTPEMKPMFVDKNI